MYWNRQPAHFSLSGWTRVPVRMDNQVVRRVSWASAGQREAMNHSDKSNEGYFRALIEGLSAPMMALGPGGILRYANPAAERLLGHSSDKLVGMELTGLVHPEEGESFARKLEVSATGRSGPNESRLRNTDGSWRWIEWTASSLPEHCGERQLVWTGCEISRSW